MENEPTMFCQDCDYPLDGLESLACPECGQPFDPRDPMTFNRHLGDAVKVYVARDLMDAHLVRGVFEGEGIPAVVLGDGLDALSPAITLSAATLPSVWVGMADVARAQAALAEHVADLKAGAAAREAELPAWTCPLCGEQVDGDFDVCWNCQTARS